MSALLRKAKSQDVVALKQLLWDTHRPTWEPHLSEHMRKRFNREGKIEAYVHTMHEEFVVAELKSNVIGMVDWRENFICALHVRTDMHGIGIGSQLLAFAEGCIEERGYATASLETNEFNSRSLAFYRQRGYLEEKRYPDDQWDGAFVTVLLKKPFSTVKTGRKTMLGKSRHE